MTAILAMSASLYKLVAICILSSIAGICIYRWKFHRLAKYPGPVLAKLTSFYITYYLVRGNLHIQQRLLHKRYGPIVRIGPDRLLFDSATALHEIYQSRNIQKSRGYPATDPVPGYPNVFTSIDKNIHRLKRKALSPGFSDQFIRKFEHVILRSVDEFVEAILATVDDATGANAWSSHHDMSDRCKYFTLDIMGVFGFGRSFNVQKDPANRGIILGMRAGGICSGLYAQFPELRCLNIHKHFKINGAWTQERHGAFVREMIQERVKGARDAELDLFSFVIETKDPETGNVFKLNDLWAESRFFLIAGSDTSATVLSSVFFYLSRFPTAHQKLVQELESAFTSNDEVRLGPALSACHYLRAVIDESMRLSPPVGNALWREVCAPGQVIQGTFIPPGVEVGVSLYALFHTESIFPQADQFVPERFLDDGPFPGQLEQARAAFKPFSLGSRNCAGMNLAYAEMLLLVAKVVRMLDFKQPDDPQQRQIGGGSADGIEGRQVANEFQLRAFITSLHEGPILQFRRR